MGPPLRVDHGGLGILGGLHKCVLAVGAYDIKMQEASEVVAAGQQGSVVAAAISGMIVDVLLTLSESDFGGPDCLTKGTGKLWRDQSVYSGMWYEVEQAKAHSRVAKDRHT
jgi:hypothetical protein